MAVNPTHVSTKDQVVRHLITVQIVHYHCSNCGDEVEEVKLCNLCKAPMRVIEVTEKFGEDAEKYLENIKNLSNSNIKTDYVGGGNLDSGIDNAFADEEELKQIDEIDTGYGPIKSKSEDEIMSEFAGLDDGIFAMDDDDNAPAPKRKDLEDLLVELDKDEGGTDPNGDFADDDLESFKDL